MTFYPSGHGWNAVELLDWKPGLPAGLGVSAPSKEKLSNSRSGKYFREKLNKRDLMSNMLLATCQF